MVRFFTLRHILLRLDFYVRHYATFITNFLKHILFSIFSEFPTFRLTFKITDVFLCPIREKCEAFLRAQKNVGEKNTQRAFQRKAHARLWFFEPRAAACRRRSSYCLLNAGFTLFYFYIIIL